MGEGAKRKAAPAGDGANTSYWPKKSKKEKKGLDGELAEKKPRRKREGDDASAGNSASVGVSKKKKEGKKSSGGKKASSKGDRTEDGAAGAGAAKPGGEYVNNVPQNHKEQKELTIKRKKERNPHFDMVQEVGGCTQNTLLSAAHVSARACARATLSIQSVGGSPLCAQPVLLMC